MRRTKNPMPTVEYDGREYKLKSRRTEIPDFKSMSRIQALIWLNTYTRARGYSKPPNPLRGLGEIITIRAN